MDPSASLSSAAGDGADAPVARAAKSRTDSISQKSGDSQTAADFLRSQMQLEADAREALPYSIEHCTNPLGPLRQSVFACLTCNPPPANPSDPYTNPAGVCYACSVQCHGEHTLVEIFSKRNFTCDCGTTRFPRTSPCNLRLNPKTGTKGGVHSEEPSPNNKYNQNFRNRFCGCECDYDPFQQKGTMFQCLGLGTHETGGCGEDWWHPGCVVGLGPNWFENMTANKVKVKAEGTETNGLLPTITEDEKEADYDDSEPPPPPGFPAEDEFEGFICYKCVEAYPWIKRYAGAAGFLPPVFFEKQGDTGSDSATTAAPAAEPPKKRKAADDEDEADSQTSKRPKADPESTDQLAPSPPSQPADAPLDTENTPKPAAAQAACKLTALPAPPQGLFSLFFTDSFRDHLCHCPSCFPQLAQHPQLLEEEETYEPPVSEDGDGDGDGEDNDAHVDNENNNNNNNGGGDNDNADTRSNRSGGAPASLYERGESALRSVDRVRAIEGVMAYQHLRDKLMPFFQQFAESGRVISAEDVKEYFAKLRGDDRAIRDAAEAAERNGGGRGGGSSSSSNGGNGNGGGDGGTGSGGGGGGFREEQSGY